MKHHRIIWIITGAIVLVCGIILAVRDARAPAIQPADQPVIAAAGMLSPQQMHIVIDSMTACIDADPQARRVNTRSLIEAVASLAENGVLESAETYYALGLRLSGQQQFEAAEKAYRKAIELRPDWNWAHSGLGILLQAEGRMDDAEKSIRKAVELDQHWSRAHNDLAVLLRITGRLQEAEVEAKKALELDPTSVATHNNYGNLLVALKRFDDAEKEYQKAIDVEPDHPAPYFNLACLACLRGRRERVAPLLMCAIAFDDVYRDQARVDTDLQPMHGDLIFDRLVAPQSSQGSQKRVIKPDPKIGGI